MELNGYVDDLRHHLAIAAAAGGDDARELAERLTAPLDSATRLILLDALSTAAGEITSELAPGSVEVRLRGRDPEFVVTPPPTSGGIDDVTDDLEQQIRTAIDAELTDSRDATQRIPTSHDIPDDGTTARITLRIPNHLKLRAEAAAAADGISVNTWLMRAVTTALDAATAPTATQPQAQPPTGGAKFTGWVR